MSIADNDLLAYIKNGGKSFGGKTSAEKLSDKFFNFGGKTFG